MRASKHLPACAHQATPHPAGLSLLECLCAVALLGVLSLWSVPTLESLSQRLKVDIARERWLSDLDLARSWSARNGQVSMLTRRSECPGLTDARDWRCGWRVMSAEGARMLGDSPLPGDVSLVYSANTGELRIAASGDPISAGASLRIKPWRTEFAALASTICLNIAGRVHWQAGEGCS
jgi:prepilin-type N-terminal cleavage/methylation domain-containing protein